MPDFRSAKGKTPDTVVDGAGLVALLEGRNKDTRTPCERSGHSYRVTGKIMVQDGLYAYHGEDVRQCFKSGRDADGNPLCPVEHTPNGETVDPPFVWVLLTLLARLAYLVVVFIVAVVRGIAQSTRRTP